MTDAAVTFACARWIFLSCVIARCDVLLEESTEEFLPNLPIARTLVWVQPPQLRFTYCWKNPVVCSIVKETQSLPAMGKRHHRANPGGKSIKMYLADSEQC